ncbi:MAG TPA: hypothetical protein VIK80_03020 [Flavihumibacter sp.]
MKKIILGSMVLLAMASCSTPPQKKVVVMASGKFTVSQTGDAIKFEPGTQHNEQVITLKGDKITLDDGSGSKELLVAEPGVYLLNLKNDTLIGSLQVFGDASTRESRITQDVLMERMDSLQQLMLGQNLSPEKKNHFLAPRDFKKITSEDDAIVVGPFRGIPASLTPDKNGRVPEVYKFITNKDARATLDRLNNMLKEQ